MPPLDKKPYWRDALLAFGRMSSWVVGPVVVALFVGKWLDKKFHTAPYLFLAATALAFVSSMYGLYKEGSNYKRAMEVKTKGELTKNDNGGTTPLNN